jgi:hypothetical protein
MTMDETRQTGKGVDEVDEVWSEQSAIQEVKVR